MEKFIQTKYLPRGYLINIEGKVKSPFNKILKTAISNSGYYFLNIKNKGYFIHRAVAFGFLPLVSGKKNVNHKDGNKLNIKLDNLEWCTKSENCKHAYLLGLKKQTVSSLFKGKFGKDHNRSIKITCNGIEYNGYSEASRELNTPIGTIHYRVKSKAKKWMHFQIKD